MPSTTGPLHFFLLPEAVSVLNRSDFYHSRRYRRGASHPLLLATAAVSGLLVVSCLVCAGMTYIGVNSSITYQLKEEFGDIPVVKDHLGEIRSAWVNVDDSRAIQQQPGLETYIVYDVEGSDGEGQLIIEQGKEESLVGKRGFLRFDGEDFTIGPPPAPEEEVSKEDPAEPESP